MLLSLHWQELRVDYRPLTEKKKQSMGNLLSQTYPGEAPKLTEKNLPNQSGKVGGISVTIIVICDQKEREKRRRLLDDF
jgi:hypothetical protein